MKKGKKKPLGPPAVVTFRTIEIDFESRTVNIDGSRIEVTSRGLSIPILSGDEVFLPRSGWERIR